MRSFLKAILAIALSVSMSSLATSQVLVPTPINDGHFHVAGVTGPASAPAGGGNTINVTLGGLQYNLCPGQNPVGPGWLYAVKFGGVTIATIKFKEPVIIQGFPVYPWCYLDGTDGGYIVIFN